MPEPADSPKRQEKQTGKTQAVSKKTNPKPAAKHQTKTPILIAEAPELIPAEEPVIPRTEPNQPEVIDEEPEVLSPENTKATNIPETTLTETTPADPLELPLADYKELDQEISAILQPAEAPELPSIEPLKVNIVEQTEVVAALVPEELSTAVIDAIEIAEPVVLEQAQEKFDEIIETATKVLEGIEDLVEQELYLEQIESTEIWEQLEQQVEEFLEILGVEATPEQVKVFSRLIVEQLPALLEKHSANTDKGTHEVKQTWRSARGFVQKEAQDISNLIGKLAIVLLNDLQSARVAAQAK